MKLMYLGFIPRTITKWVDDDEEIRGTSMALDNLFFVFSSLF